MNVACGQFSRRHPVEVEAELCVESRIEQRLVIGLDDVSISGDGRHRRGAAGERGFESGHYIAWIESIRLMIGCQK